MMRLLGIIIALILAGGLGAAIYKRAMEADPTPGGGPGGGGPGRRGPAVVAVEVQPIRTATIRDLGTFTGQLDPAARFNIAPKIAGRLEKLMVQIGDPVKKDELVAVLESSEYEQQAQQTKAELEVARAAIKEVGSMLEVSRREFERAQTLREKKIASEAELDTALATLRVQDAKYRVGQAEVEKRQSALDQAQTRLGYTRISASWDGPNETRFIGERFVDEGALLQANTPIVSVLDLDPMKAIIHVIERDYSRVRQGQEAVVTTDAYPGTTFTGTIVRMAPLLQETSRQARAEIEIKNPKFLLKPGMFVRAEIEYDRKENVTVVPTNALANREGKQGIFLADPRASRARFVPVTLGIVQGEQAQVVEPALSGSVIVLGHHLLEDGTSITLPGATPKAKPGGPSRGAKPGGKA